MPPKKQASAANSSPPPSPLPSTTIPHAPITTSWLPVFSPTGTLIPYLRQTTLPNTSVRKTAHADPKTKTVRYLLVTVSDGGRLIEDNTGFAPDQFCYASDARYSPLMVQLGGALAASLDISSGSSNGNGAGDATWDVLAQLPLKYNAYYKTRKDAAATMDLYIVGHERGSFDSVRQFGTHLAWLAGDDGAACGCKPCTADRNKGVVVGKQVERKRSWVEHQGPAVEGVPRW